MFRSLRGAGARISTRNIVIKPSEHGQPTILSHPHLSLSALSAHKSLILTVFTVRRNDITPGFPGSEYEQRRRNLMELLPEKSIAVTVSSPIKFMSGSECAHLNHCEYELSRLS